jgi:hypothetical protein
VLVDECESAQVLGAGRRHKLLKYRWLAGSLGCTGSQLHRKAAEAMLFTVIAAKADGLFSSKPTKPLSPETLKIEFPLKIKRGKF